MRDDITQMKHTYLNKRTINNNMEGLVKIWGNFGIVQRQKKKIKKTKAKLDGIVLEMS